MGGDHKCPLCSATFTRPQHVGRHLRAHTGDRPYECKECPLRFARSDLLSRHVNKAHPKPNGPNDNKNEKKGRSKSMSSTNGMAPARPPPMVNRGRPVAPHQPEPTPYQAQRMYPNHPLLQQNHNPGWTTDIWGSGVANFNMGLAGPTGHIGPDVIGPLGNTAVTLLPPVNGTPLTYASSEPDPIRSAYDLSNSLPNLSTSQLTTIGYELNVKKRACDQCNHSKVRCDFADPCARCTHRHVQCTYTKPPRNTRARNVTYPIPNVPGQQLFSTSPPTKSMPMQYSSPTSRSIQNSPILARSLHENDAAAMARRASEQSSASSDIFGSDRVRPPVPDPLWDTPPTQARSQSIATTASTSSFVAQSPKSGHGLLFASVPAETAGMEGDLNGAVANNGNGNWILPPSVMSQESAIKFVNSCVAQQQNGDMGVLQGNPQLVWPNHPGGIDSTIMPSDSALSLSQDELSDNTAPGSTVGKDEIRRRRSSAGVWTNALKEMHLDDTFVQPLLDPALEQLPFNDLQAPMDRTISNSDLNLWKLFLDPGVLATPDKLASLEFNHESRGLSKSNSAPDLTTPSTVTNNFPDPLETYGVKKGAMEFETVPDERIRRASGDDGTENLWKHQIQQRHASFSMNPDAAATVRTRALTNARFASSNPRQMRPPLHPLMHHSTGDETLAPERLPSFGPAMFEGSGVPTPGGALRSGPMTPTRLLTLSDARPANKRQASQTLVGDTQKRGTFLIWPDDDLPETGSLNSSRRSSGPTSLPPKAAVPAPNVPVWQSTDPPVLL